MLAEIILSLMISTNPFNIDCEPYKYEGMDYLGTYEVTAYSYNEGYENTQTASGETPEPYYTVAVDPEVIPLGTELYIEDIGTVKAQDTGGAVKGNVIDIHIGYDNCNSFGRQKKKVYR